MLKRIVMQLNGLVMVQFTQALAWLTALLWKVVNSLRASYIRLSQSVVNLLHRLVKILSNFKVLLASLITQVQSIKLVLKRAVTINGQIGQQLLTIARQTLQLVKQALKKDK